MLVMPLDRIALLLNQASVVEVEGEDTVPADVDAERGASDEGDAYRALTAALDSLTEEELSELLALAAFGEQQDDDASWELVRARIRSVDQEDALDQLLRALIYTDAIETGLSRLGLSLSEAEAEDQEEETESREETEQGEQPEDVVAPLD